MRKIAFGFGIGFVAVVGWLVGADLYGSDGVAMGFLVAVTAGVAYLALRR